MEKRNLDFTQLDNFFFENFTQKLHKNTRNVYICNINKKNDCDKIFYSRIPTELKRFFIHLRTNHPDELQLILIKWLNDHPRIDLNTISCVNIICQYMISNILPFKQNPQENSLILHNEFLSPSEIDLNRIDLNKIGQVVLEQGIAENQPLSTISSKNHCQFISGFLKVGFILGRDTQISKNDFLKIANDIKIPRGLINQVGGDYFLASINAFKGGYACFQIDAGTICTKSILTFVISANQRYSFPMVFDIIDEFDGTLKAYKNAVCNEIDIAKKNEITITGIVTDNLPTQIMALSHLSSSSFQNCFKDVASIIHLRCCNHLLCLAFKDWMKIENDITKYEIKINHIIQILRKKPFVRYLKHKIPLFNKTRWNSPFNTLEMLFKNRVEFLDLFKNPRKSFLKGLKEIKDDFYYLITTGFTQIYPLLYPYLKLTYHLQDEQISCVHAVLIIQFYLDQMINNIEEYKIPEIGQILIKKIENRLLLNKNVQMYQLASLFTPDGIIRYRNIIKNEYNIPEEDNYWHNNEGFISMELYSMKNTLNVHSYILGQLNNFKSVIKTFNPQIKRKQKSNKKNTIDKETLKKDSTQKKLTSFFDKMTPKKAEIENDISDSSDEIIIYERRNKLIDEFTDKITDPKDNIQEKDDHLLSSICSSQNSESQLSITEEEKEKVEKNNQNDNHENSKTQSSITEEVEESHQNDIYDISEVHQSFITDDENQRQNKESYSNSNSSDYDFSNDGYSEDEHSDDEYSDDEYSEREYNDKNQKYFDESKNSDQVNDDIQSDSDLYQNQENALKWKNISNLIYDNAVYLGLNKEEAINAAIELNCLLRMPFSILRQYCPVAIDKNSDYMTYWSTIQDFEYKGHKFENIAKIAFRIFPISASESGAERSFSNFGWKFTKRRNRISKKTMINEIHIQDAHKKKIRNNSDYSKTMWELPQHK